jgi:hypothetical protein
MVAPLWGDPNQTHVGGLPYGIPLSSAAAAGPPTYDCMAYSDLGLPRFGYDVT